MTFGIFHDGNIDVVGEGRGDDVARLGFDLSWSRLTPGSSLDFRWRPVYVHYQKTEDADYFSNTLILDYSREATRRSRFSVSADASRTEYQGQTADRPDRPITFVPRTTETRVGCDVGGTVSVGRRALLDWSVRAGASFFDDLADNPATPAVDPVDYNDSTNVGGRTAWRHEISEQASIGVGLDLTYFGYEQFSGVFVESVGLVGSNELGRSSTLTYAAGASRSSSDGDASTDFAFSATFTRDFTEDSSLSTGARQSIAPGTGLGGATQDRGAWLSYGHESPARGLTGSVLGGYWQRIGVDFAGSTSGGDTETINVTGSLGWRFNRFVSLDTYYAYVDQSALHGTDPGLETSYSSYGVYVRWAMRGR